VGVDSMGRGSIGSGVNVDSKSVRQLSFGSLEADEPAALDVEAALLRFGEGMGTRACALQGGKDIDFVLGFGLCGNCPPADFQHHLAVSAASPRRGW